MLNQIVNPVAGRACSGCTMCCKVLGITEIDKPVGAWCPSCDIGNGCRIYGNRPVECQTFMCGWLYDDRFSDVWKPDRSKLVVTSGRDGNSLEIRCDPGLPAAWRAKPYYDEIIRIARAAEPADGSLYVIVGKRSTLVTPDREFLLGEVSDDQVIVKEMRGHTVVDVKVLPASEVRR